MYVQQLIQNLARWLKRHTICRVRGHLSTGTLLWWMCDRCHEDFKDNARPSRWVGDVKITTSY